MANSYKKTDISEIVDGTLTPSEEEIREQAILKQKEKRKRKQIEEKERAKQEKIDKKKEERKKHLEKENKIKQGEKEKNAIKKNLEKKQKREEKQKVIAQKEKEKQQKLIEKRKREEREKRIQQRKNKKEDDEFEYEANSAIKMTMKNNKRRKEAEELSKQQRAKIKRKKRIKKMITCVMLIAIMIGGGAFAFISPIFNIKEIQVLDNEQVSKETIESLSGLHEGENIFRFLKINVKQAIKKEAYIEDVEIKRKLPTTVEIKVKERKSSFSIAFLNSYAVINNQGYILEMTEQNKGLPIIKGINTDEGQISTGNRLNNEDLSKLETAIKIINTFKDNNLDGQVTSIDLTDENECKVEMEQEQKTIYLGDKTNLSNKIIYVQAIINETKNKKGEIFVNGDLNNKFKPYFRENVQ